MKKLSLIVCAALLSGCVGTSQYGASAPSRYKSTELSQAQTTQYAKLLSFKPITIEGESGIGEYVGTAVGAGLAGYGASHIGGGNAKYASATVGAVLGGTFANEFMKAWNESNGVELTVQLEKTKQVLTFAQEGNANEFVVGQRVKVVQDRNGKVRVDNSQY